MHRCDFAAISHVSIHNGPTVKATKKRVFYINLWLRDELHSEIAVSGGLLGAGAVPEPVFLSRRRGTGERVNC